MKKKIKIGIIGAGAIASLQHIPGYSKIEGVELVAVCDVIKEKAKGVFNMWGPWNSKKFDVEDYAVGLVRFAVYIPVKTAG